uniref:Nucleotide-diphospho-sugar transferase domain-containing protein n=1 Tax=Plectus sambesii TaxID=2011161 RepID=A0A914XNL4_9BILA
MAEYDLLDVDTDNDKYAKTTCAEFQDRNFRRHCILAQYLKKSDAKYALAMDGDMAVVNPHHCIEDYINSNASLIFYERFHTFEITASSFIVKNDAYGIEFLMDWAHYSRKVPRSLLLEKRVVSSHERAMCTRLWQHANTVDNYMKYIQCAYIFLGSKRNDLSEQIKILRRGHGWGRDGWTSDGKWCDHDFLMHAIKAVDYSSLQKIDSYTLNDGHAVDKFLPFLQPFNLNECKPGHAYNDTYHMKPELHVPCDELRTKLKGRLIVPKTVPLPYLDDSDLDCWPSCEKLK